MTKALALLSCVLLLFSCETTDESLTFTQSEITKQEGANVQITFPKANGNDDVASAINNSVETAIASGLSFNEELKDTDIEDAISIFDKEYRIFKNDFPESNQVWEAVVESEVVYESPELISILISTYVDTGGAHGNTHIIFLNFDPDSGEELFMDNLITDKEKFTELTTEYFKQNLESRKHELDVVDSFYGEDFKLPETIGFSEEGVIILYNTYEIAAYSFGITEFEIPWEDASQFISRR